MCILKVLLLSISKLSCYWYLTILLYVALEKEMATHSSILAWRILWTEEPGGLLSMGSHRVGHDWSNLACMHALEKEMATHSSILAWRVLWTEEPGGLWSMGLHRVGHDWSDLAAAVVLCSSVVFHCISIPQFSFIFSLRKYFDCLSPFLFLFQIMLFMTNILLHISLSQMWEFLVLRYI